MSVTKVTGMMQTGTKGGDIPSASTLVIDTDGDYFDITGTTGITAMTVDAGRRFTLQFDGAVTLTHGSSLYLPGATNFTTEANDCLSFIATAANTVRCTGYALKDGGSPVAAAGGSWTLISTVVLSNQSSVDFTGLSSTYAMYAIICSAVGMNTPAGQQIWFRVSTDNGSSFISAGQYRYHVSNQHDGDSGYYRINATTDSKLRVSRSSADAGATMQMQLFFSGHATTNQYMPVHWNGAFNGGTNGTEWWHGAGGWNQNTNVNAVQIVGDGGTFDTGRITLYGITHA